MQTYPSIPETPEAVGVADFDPVPFVLKLLITLGIKAFSIDRGWRKETRPFQDLIFGERIQGSQSCVGLRFGDKPSPWDRLAVDYAFIHPLTAMVERLPIIQRFRKRVLRDPRKHLMFIGGWRPMLEVEMMLRKAPIIFGIKKEKRIWVPNSDELQDIRRNPERRINWVVYDQESKKVYEPTKPGERDLVIITKAENPLNPDKKAIALSGTHREGTLGASLALSDRKCLEKIVLELEREACIDKNFQIAMWCYFVPLPQGWSPPLGLMNVDIIRATSF